MSKPEKITRWRKRKYSGAHLGFRLGDGRGPSRGKHQKTRNDIFRSHCGVLEENMRDENFADVLSNCNKFLASRGLDINPET